MSSASEKPSRLPTQDPGEANKPENRTQGQAHPENAVPLQDRPAPDRAGSESEHADHVGANAQGKPTVDNVGMEAHESPTGHVESTRDTEEMSAYATHEHSKAARQTPVADKSPLK